MSFLDQTNLKNFEGGDVEAARLDAIREVVDWIRKNKYSAFDTPENAEFCADVIHDKFLVKWKK